MIVAWRLFRMLGGHPATLYHTHAGSKMVPLDVWLTAEQKVVWNPGKRTAGGKPFRAGFHVFMDTKELLKYCKNMDPYYYVTPVLVKELRKKPRSRSSVMLAKRMMVCSDHWAGAITLGAWLR